MPAIRKTMKTYKKLQKKKNTRKSKKGGVFGTLLKTGLGAAALAKGQQTQLTGPGYAVGRPHPSRNGRLNVLPTPTPRVAPFFDKHTIASERVWPTPTPGPTGWLDPAPGTRWVSPPEVQTWNPYLRGDPNEVVDYYEGYSAKDKSKRLAEDKAAGINHDSVPRKNTPMWKAAASWSVDLPNKDLTTYTPMHWKSFAERGRALGMNVPLNDPRNSNVSVSAKWANVPNSVNTRILRHQMYHSGNAPLRMNGYEWSGENGQYGSMKWGKPVPKHWRNSEKTHSNNNVMPGLE